MNSHKHARLTYARRLEMVKQMTEGGLSAAQAALAQGVTAPTARKWLGRYLAGGESALSDASSRPASSPRAIEPAKALLIVELRRRRMLHARIAQSVGVDPRAVAYVAFAGGGGTVVVVQAWCDSESGETEFPRVFIDGEVIPGAAYAT